MVVDKYSMLYEIIGVEKLSVKSYHHQAVQDIGSGLKKCAESGDKIVEGIESTNSRFTLGIQWHPELEDGDISKKIFKSFIDECRPD